MNASEIKETFYKRYDTSDKFLHYTFTGMLCTFLGHESIQGAPFLSCPLSMGVAMLARRLGGGIIKIQDAASDKQFSYTIGAPTGLFKGRDKETASLLSELGSFTDGGAEILYKSDIPQFLPQNSEFNLSLVKSLIKTSGKQFSPMQEAFLAANGEHISGYLPLAYAKSGYCTLISDDMPKSYPLPLTGYKIITAYVKTKDRSRADRIYDALDAVRSLFPEVQSAADLTLAHAYRAQQSLKNKTSVDYIHHLAGENMRISAAVRGLRRCDIRSLFRAMNASETSMEKHWHLRAPQIFFARIARATEGISAVRCGEKEIVMIAEGDKVDYAVQMIKNDFEYNLGYKPVFCVSDAV